MCNLETVDIGLTGSSITWHIMRPFIILCNKSLLTPMMNWLDVGSHERGGRFGQKRNPRCGCFPRISEIRHVCEFRPSIISRVIYHQCAVGIEKGKSNNGW